MLLAGASADGRCRSPVEQPVGSAHPAISPKARRVRLALREALSARSGAGCSTRCAQSIDCLLQGHRLIFSVAARARQLVLTPQTVNPLRLPTIARSRSQPQPIQRGGDLSIGELGRHPPNHFYRFRASSIGRVAPCRACSPAAPSDARQPSGSAARSAVALLSNWTKTASPLGNLWRLRTGGLCPWSGCQR
jgi:hypothetical protein